MIPNLTSVMAPQVVVLTIPPVATKWVPWQISFSVIAVVWVDPRSSALEICVEFKNDWENPIPYLGIYIYIYLYIYLELVIEEKWNAYRHGTEAVMATAPRLYLLYS